MEEQKHSPSLAPIQAKAKAAIPEAGVRWEDSKTAEYDIAGITALEKETEARQQIKLEDNSGVINVPPPSAFAPKPRADVQEIQKASNGKVKDTLLYLTAGAATITGLGLAAQSVFFGNENKPDLQSQVAANSTPATANPPPTPSLSVKPSPSTIPSVAPKATAQAPSKPARINSPKPPAPPKPAQKSPPLAETSGIVDPWKKQK